MDTAIRQAAPDRPGATTAQADRAAPSVRDEWVDNRAAATLQRRLGELAERSPRLAAQAALNGAVAHSPRMVAQRAVNRTGLPDRLKNGVEHLSGMAMDDVRVHYNSSAPAQLQALAYARGSEIHLAPGQEQHLPHEAWHLVQQRQGRVAATLQAKGVDINDDPGLEHEADVMGARALQGGAPAQLRSNGGAAHGGGCACPGCHGGPAFQLKYGFEGAGVVQRVVTVTIADANGVQRTGTSGNESDTRDRIERWPALAAEFLRVVQPHQMPERDAAGQLTGRQYSRGRYMCAEPHALSLLLHHYYNLNHGLGAGFVGALTFPAIGIDSVTGGNIAPCPVCSQWVNDAAVPMTVHALNAVPMKNKLEFDRDEEDRARRDAAIRQAEMEEKEKSARKAAKSAQELAAEQKRTTAAALQAACDAALLHRLVGAYIRIKKLSLAKHAAEIKQQGDAWLEGWIMGMATTNLKLIQIYEKFDDGQQAEFVAWVRDHGRS